MNETVEFARRAVLIGAEATIVMDLWAVVLRQFGVPSLNLAFLGRWIGHLPRGHWRHLKHRERDAGPRRMVDRMDCALRDRCYLLGALAVRCLAGHVRSSLHSIMQGDACRSATPALRAARAGEPSVAGSIIVWTPTRRDRAMFNPAMSRRTQRYGARKRRQTFEGGCCDALEGPIAPARRGE